MVPQRSPNTHGGSGSVRLRGRDLTRMTRAMQKDGLKSVDFTVSGSARSRQKAARTRCRTPCISAPTTRTPTAETTSPYGVPSKRNSTGRSRSRHAGSSPPTRNSGLDARCKQSANGRPHHTWIRNPHRQPQSCCEPKYGTNRFYSSDIQMRDSKVALPSTLLADTPACCPTGTVSASARSRLTQEGFIMFNNGKSPANPYAADNVKVLSDGNFRVGKTVRKRSTRHPCPLPAGLVAATESFTATTRPGFRQLTAMTSIAACPCPAVKARHS